MIRRIFMTTLNIVYKYLYLFFNIFNFSFPNLCQFRIEFITILKQAWKVLFSKKIRLPYKRCSLESFKFFYFKYFREFFVSHLRMLLFLSRLEKCFIVIKRVLFPSFVSLRPKRIGSLGDSKDHLWVSVTVTYHHKI